MPYALRRKPQPKPAPQSDPRFQRVTTQLKTAAARTKAHPPAARKAEEAAKAAKGPPNERVAGGKAKQVDKIKEAKEGKPDQNSFLAMLRAEIAKAMPKNLGETENNDAAAAGMKSGLKGNVAQQKEKSTQDVSGAAKQAPGPAGEAKVGGNVPPDPVPPPPNVPAAEGMPQPKSAADISLQDSVEKTNADLKENRISQKRLDSGKKAGDPRYTAVDAAKGQVAQSAAAGPARYRAAESGILGAARAQATTQTRVGAAAMIGVRRGGNARVLTRQQQQKARDEAKRKEVVDRIEAIYAATKTRVEAKLSALDTEVNGVFDRGVDAAIASLTKFLNDKIFDYKVRRYLSVPLLGLAAWVRDQFMGLPDEVQVIYNAGRALFQAQMDVLIVRVANLVEQRLREAKLEVAKGQRQIQEFVASQPKELQGIARQAQNDVNNRFKELEQGIESKKNQLAESLAQKYKEAHERANKAIEEVQNANKGLVEAFVEKLGELIKALTEFKNKLLAVIRKGAETIDLILDDPIGFLGNLIAAVKGGLSAFVGNIWTHLKQGFLRWLFGNLPPGVAPPSDLSLPSIFKLVMGVLGITYERMRAKAVRLVGERTVAVIEKVVEYVRVLIAGGPAALWEKVKEDLSNLKGMVIDAIQDWLITTIIKNAIAKIVSMFNPAGAIIQAIMAIYNIVMFVIERAAQIMAFVESVINSIHAIATGSIGGAIKKVETALANTLPIVIGFLARLIGLGGISQKIRDFIMKVQAKVDAAIDKAIKKIVEFVKKTIGRLVGRRGPADQRSDADKLRDLRAAVAEGTQLLRDRSATRESTSRRLPAIRNRYKLTRLEVVKVSGDNIRETDRVVGAINPEEEGPTVVIDAGDGVTLSVRDEEMPAQRITDPARMLPAPANPTVITDPARLLAAGRPTTRTMAQAANVKGTGKERGSALEEYVHEMAGGQREVTVQTRLGARRHDVGNVPQTTQTQMAYEAKNYRRWVTVNSVKVEQQVPLNAFIRSEIDRDFLWMREGRRLNPPVHRIVQWVFGGAHPHPDLAALLQKRGIPYVTRG